MPRPNIPMTREELMLAQVRRAQELRNRDVRHEEWHEEDEDLGINAYVAVFCILLTVILMLAIA